MLRLCTAVSSIALLSACADRQTESELALLKHGYSEAYVAGFHDGCPSGRVAGGDSFAQRARDASAYASGGDYRTGWDFGFHSCAEETRRELAVASTVGEALAAGIAGASSHGADGIDARDALSGVDTSDIAAAGW